MPVVSAVTDDGHNTDSGLAILRGALQGRGQPGVEQVRGEAGGYLDPAVLRALSAPLIAGFMVAAAVFRGQVNDAVLDPLGAVLRTLAFAFAVRALLLLAAWWRQRARAGRAAEQALAWSEHGILFRDGQSEVFAARSEVVGIDLREERRTPWGRQRARPLWITLRSEGAPRYIELPANVCRNSELLHARLSRWWAEPEPEDAADEAPSAPGVDGHAIYQRAVAGELPPGATAVREGQRWLRRGPYGALLVAFFVLDLLRSVGGGQGWPMAAGALALCAAVPAGWWLWMRRRARPRGGLAMLLTPAQLLVWGTGSVVELPWHELGEVEVESRNQWSPFVGAYPVQQLVLTTTAGEALRFDADLLSVPPEVVGALCRGYRRG